MSFLDGNEPPQEVIRPGTPAAGGASFSVSTITTPQEVIRPATPAAGGASSSVSTITHLLIIN